MQNLVETSGSTLMDNPGHRAGHGRPADRPHRTGSPVPHLGGVRELRRCYPGGDRQRKLAEGKTMKEAERCLKRRLADHVWRVMIADERRAKFCLIQAA
ncbi:hypothetical protein [Streptomyces sp. CB02400]|uniref:hypothetical protein n=1 Tax=Streptomyces sp. CB02400 TaxID=1703944 RepID=UPI003FA71F0B